MATIERERSLAMFVDLENLAMGFQNQRKTRFDIEKVLERLVEKGKLIVKKAYADWSRYQGYTAPFHEAAIELIEIPGRSQTGKNSADIRLVVDAMDLAWSKPHVDTFVIVSGDSDFSPLVSKLKENGKHVIGLGMKGSTSELLRDNCDEFIYYEDLERQEQDDQQIATNLSADLPDRKREVYTLLIEACNALRRENHEVLYASMIKDTMKRKKPSFDESVLRLPELHPPARRGRQPRPGRHRAQPAQRDVRGQGLRRARGPQAPLGRQGAHGLASPGRAQRGPDAGSRAVGRGALTRPGSRASRDPPTDGRPMVDHLPRCRGPERISRREMLQVGGAGLLGLSLPGLLRAEAEATGGRAGLSPRADACILIFLNGGPSHLDMWDMKPERPGRDPRRVPARSPPRCPACSCASTCRGWPGRCTTARSIRSVHHSVNNAHAAAVYVGLTGHDRGDATVAIGTGPNDYPAIGSVVGLLPAARDAGRAVRVAAVHHEGGARRPAAAGLLRRLARPERTTRCSCCSDPNAPDFGMPELGLAGRRQPRTPRRPQAPVGRPGLGADGGRARPTAPGHGRRSRPGRSTCSPRPATQRAFQLDREHADGPRRLRPQHLRPERAAGPPADRGRHPRRLHLVGPRRQRHLGHARQQLQQAQERAAAAARRRRVEPAGRPGRRAACWSGRWWR